MASEDRKYAWAAYKLGAFGPQMDADSKVFTDQLNEYIALHDVAFIVESITKKGRIPIGLVVGKYIGPILQLIETTWFPWATARNKMESMTNLLNDLRKRYVVTFVCSIKDRDFFVNIAKHGVLRRVGTLYDLFTDGPAPFFQTRKQ